MKHNHPTRDIKPYGECSGCDEYHDSQNPYIVKIPKYMYEVDKSWDIIHGDERFIQALMKVVCGWALGRTFEHFMIELGFAEEDALGKLFPTDFGKKFLYYYYQKGSYKSKFLYEGKDY